MIFEKENLVKSPLNYIGNKYKLLEQILPLFPNKIDSFYDLFGGSGTVFINTSADRFIYNELNTRIYDLVKHISNCNVLKELELINKTIELNNLGKEHKEEFNKFREIYNDNQTPTNLFVLSCFSLNQQLRFNKKGKFNMTCGNRGLSKGMIERFKIFNKHCENKNIEWNNKSYMEFKDFKENDFVYLDPPCLPTTATYNENREIKGWSLETELQMYQYLDSLNDRGIKWALSNVSWYRGEENKVLNNWSNKYNVHNLNISYNNNHCWSRDNTLITQEVLITNY